MAKDMQMMPACQDMHDALTGAGYDHEQTTTTTTADRTRTTSSYSKPSKVKLKGEGPTPSHMRDRVTVTKDSSSGEATWNRDYYDEDGQWQTASGASASGMRQAMGMKE